MSAAEKLVREWYGNEPALAKPIVIKEMVNLLEQYGRLVQEAAAQKVTEHYQSMCAEHKIMLVSRATAIRSMELP